MLRTAFDLGITHFDLANNYGPPYGSAEANFGRLFREDFRPYRDELIISAPRPAGTCGRVRTGRAAGRASTCWRASTRASGGMGLDYVDIFYSHRFDADTPLEETMGALATAVQQGKALYVGHLVVLAGQDARGRAPCCARWASRC